MCTLVGEIGNRLMNLFSPSHQGALADIIQTFYSIPERYARYENEQKTQAFAINYEGTSN